MIDYELLTTIATIILAVVLAAIAIIFTFNEKGGKQK